MRPVALLTAATFGLVAFSSDAHAQATPTTQKSYNHMDNAHSNTKKTVKSNKLSHKNS